MMNKRFIAAVLEIMIGLVLNVCYFAGLVGDYWSSFGTCFIVFGIIQLVRNIRYKTNESYREKVDTENKDERNRYISTKAWAWAGYFYVLLAAASTIVFRILGHEQLSVATAYSVCALMLLYWLSYLFLRKKY